MVNGLKAKNGMAAFKSVLSVDQADAIKAYVIKRGYDLQNAQAASDKP